MKTLVLASILLGSLSIASAQVGYPTPAGISPDKVAQVNQVMQEAHLSGGAIAEIEDRIDALVAQRDELVIDAAIAAHPELKGELDSLRKAQSDIRSRGKAARQHKRDDTSNKDDKKTKS
jgi:hypothetical protein